MNDVVVRDVTLRDGLQLVRGVLPTADKISLARFLLGCGVPSLEIGAFVRPDRVPAMADTLDVVAALDALELARCWVLVPNLVGTRRAIEAGMRQIQYVLSVSPSHNKANVGCGVSESLDGLAASVALARSHGVRVQLGLATAFTCPFEGRTPEESVLAIVSDDRAAGVDNVMVCDTIGQAVPSHVAGLVTSVRSFRPTWFHGHDTWGLGVANTWAAIGAGAVAVDAALGGLLPLRPRRQRQHRPGGRPLRPSPRLARPGGVPSHRHPRPGSVAGPRRTLSQPRRRRRPPLPRHPPVGVAAVKIDRLVVTPPRINGHRYRIRDLGRILCEASTSR